jgi:hypothetical protein
VTPPRPSKNNLGREDIAKCGASAGLIWEELYADTVRFSAFAQLPEEQISEKISRRILSGDQG